jgi:hypothetical protein
VSHDYLRCRPTVCYHQMRSYDVGRRRTTSYDVVRRRTTSYDVVRPSHDNISDHTMMSASRQSIVINSYDHVRRRTTLPTDRTMSYDPLNRSQDFEHDKNKKTSCDSLKLPTMSVTSHEVVRLTPDEPRSPENTPRKWSYDVLRPSVTVA